MFSELLRAIINEESIIVARWDMVNFVSDLAQGTFIRRLANKPDFIESGKSSIDETQYAAYLTLRFSVADDLSLILGSRVIDWKRDTTDSPCDGSPMSERTG
jgi:outer membrane receptor for ferric coprogen and ferric-rhodotorulic acid